MCVCVGRGIGRFRFRVTSLSVVTTYLESITLSSDRANPFLVPSKYPIFFPCRGSVGKLNSFKFIKSELPSCSPTRTLV